MKKYSKETSVGIFMLVGLLLVAYMAVKLGNLNLFGDDTVLINARFNKVTGLRTGNPVTMYGLRIGRVSALTIDQEKQAAMVQMRIQKDIQVYEDAVAAIKTEGLIGDKYIDIDAGGGMDALAPGGTILDTISPVDMGDIIGKYAFGSVDKE